MASAARANERSHVGPDDEVAYWSLVGQHRRGAVIERGGKADTPPVQPDWDYIENQGADDAITTLGEMFGAATRDAWS